jgi:hypothetical protein
VTAKKSNTDDRNWGLPRKNTSKYHDDKTNEADSSKPPDDDSDDDPSNPFKPSFTFFPQSELTTNLESFFTSNNKEETQQALLNRLKDFVRQKMVDHDDVNKQLNRTRKEWEDISVEQQTKAIETMMKIGALVLQSPAIKKLMSSREAQESLRQFILNIKVRGGACLYYVASIYGGFSRLTLVFSLAAPFRRPRKGSYLR